MASRRVRGFFVAALSVMLLVSLPGMAAAADEPTPTPTPTPVPPPSLETALVAILPTSALVSPDTLASAGTLEYGTAARRLPACKIKDIRTRYGSLRHWRQTLLDTRLKLGWSYKPKDLVPVSRAGIAGSGKVRRIMIRDLRALARAARQAGKPLAVRSAYRSYGYQKSLFDYYVRTQGYATAVKFSARPGHSEHQLGTTIDFTTAPGVPLSTRFGASPAGKWLARNGWKYGFIMSYPKGMKRISCYGYEPWHWRYFGRELAREIHKSGQVPRRYLWENFETAP